MMNEWADGRVLRLEAQRKIAAQNLKRCPLCGAINAVANSECFVCRWHGTFQTDPQAVDEGLGELMIRCPELVDAMLVEPVKPPSTWERIKSKFANLLWPKRQPDCQMDF